MADDNVLEEFLVNVLYNVDERKRKDFNEGLTESFTKAKLLGDALESMAQRGVAAIERYVTGMERLHYVSRNTGASVQNLQALGFAAAQLGGSAEDAVGAVESLVAKFKESPGNVQFVKNVLGVAVDGRDPTAVVMDVVKRLEKMPAYLRLSYEKMIGLTEQQFLVLSNPQVEKQMERFKARQTQMGIDPQKAAADSAEFMRAWRDIGDVINNIASLVMSRIVGGAAPQLTHFTDYLAEHGPEIADVIVKILNAVALLLTRFVEFLPHLDKMAEAFGGWDKVLLAVGAALLLVMSRLALLSAMVLPQWLLAMLGIGGAAAAAAYGLGKLTGMGSDPGAGGHTESESLLPAARERLEAYKRAHPNDTSSFEYQQLKGNYDTLKRQSRPGHGGDDNVMPSADGPPAPITNPRLAAQRRHLMDELNTNPTLRREVMKTISMENRGSPQALQAVLESMVNRSNMLGYHSLHQAVHSGFYGPVNHGRLNSPMSAREIDQANKAIAAVAAGGNLIGYRTDQGMPTDPTARRVYTHDPVKWGMAKIHGEHFYYSTGGGIRWANDQKEADRRAGAGATPPPGVRFATPRAPTVPRVGATGAAAPPRAALGVNPASIPTISSTTNAPVITNHFDVSGAVSPAETAAKVHEKLSSVHSSLVRNMKNAVG